jgi:hypothetical protein
MEELELIIEDIRCATFHMSDEEAKPVIDGFLIDFPSLLEYHDREWYYKYC